MDHGVTLLLKMLPSESEKEPDLLLTLDSDEIAKYEKIINELDRGKKIGFNATVKSFGDDGKTRHLHVVNLYESEGFLEIDPMISEGGKFDKETKKSFRGKNIKNEGA